MKPGRIAIFARAPVPGRTKTRLIPALGAEGAAALQRTLIDYTLKTALRSGMKTELWCHPDTDHPLFAAHREVHGIECRVQQGADLGARMGHAAVAAPGPVVLIGTDCPSLGPDDLVAAFAALADADAVIGPAADGGYYLLGLNRCAPGLFEEIDWGTSRVLSATRDRLRALDWRWTELATRHDIDRPEDLDHLPESITLELTCP